MPRPSLRSPTPRHARCAGGRPQLLPRGAAQAARRGAAVTVAPALLRDRRRAPRLRRSDVEERAARLLPARPDDDGGAFRRGGLPLPGAAL
eukprot:548064-Prymnesium_polylepis.1